MQEGLRQTSLLLVEEIGIRPHDESADCVDEVRENEQQNDEEAGQLPYFKTKVGAEDEETSHDRDQRKNDRERVDESEVRLPLGNVLGVAE